MAALEAAQSSLSKAEDDLSKLRTAPTRRMSPSWRHAWLRSMPCQNKPRPRLDAANVSVDAARSRLDAAKAAVAQAQAELESDRLANPKAQCALPIDGVVLTRIADTGEVIQMGAPVVTIGRLSQLKITVYLPEYRYGEVNLGQTVSVTVDSFPGQQFPATVVAIADQAEFTPRNVQTIEGRRNTVFAIELFIENPDGKFKPGMPGGCEFRNAAGE